MGKGEGRKGTPSGSDCISLGAQRHVRMVCTFLPLRIAPGPPLGCHTGKIGLKGFFLRDVCLAPTTHLRIFEGKWHSDQDLFPKFQNMKDTLQKGASPVKPVTVVESHLHIDCHNFSP